MSLPYENATSGEKALLEVQKILAQFGCQAFGTMQDIEHGEVIVHFRWQGREVSLSASWRGYAAALLKHHPYTSRSRCSKQDHEKQAFHQAQISVCSVLRDWIKGQVTAVETGILSFEAVFLPYLLLPNGERLVDRAVALLPERNDRPALQ